MSKKYKKSRKLANLYKLFELVDDHSGRVRMEECDDTREQQLVEIGQWGRFLILVNSRRYLDNNFVAKEDVSGGTGC